MQPSEQTAQEICTRDEQLNDQASLLAGSRWTQSLERGVLFTRSVKFHEESDDEAMTMVLSHLSASRHCD